MSVNEEAVLTGLVVGLGAIAIGAWLASDPHCRRGCRTVAEHLIEHGLDEFFTALLA